MSSVIDAMTRPAEPSSLEGATLCVDVRTPAEFREVHIPGSVNIPLADVELHLEELKRQGQDKQIVLVCRSGQRAAKACERLGAAGLRQCAVLEGGLARWVESGYTVERGRKAISLERQVRIAAGSMVLGGTVLGLLVHPAFFAVPVFVGGGLVFAGLTDTCGMAMLLARMPWNRGGSGSGGCAA